MDVLSIQDMMRREEGAFHAGVTADALMEAAGEAMAVQILAIYPKAHPFVVLVGKGNNGGDGLVVARHLAQAKKVVQIVLAAAEDQLGDLPRMKLNQLREVFPHLEISAWQEDFRFPDGDGVVIDALLGVQARGELRGALAGIVARLNGARETNFFRTVALDLPTGLAAYEKESAPKNRDAAVVADVTLAVGFAKDVLGHEALSGWVGRLEVAPWSREKFQSGPRQVLLGHELASLLPRRNALSHKGDFGRLVIIAGSTGFTGAAGLCTQAAQAMGTGLMYVVTRTECREVVAAQAPHEAMVSSWSDMEPKIIQKASAIAIGPGVGKSERTLHKLRTVLDVGCPVVIDADGLNVLSQNIHLLFGAKSPILLTPHPGEMSRLIGRKFGPEEREAVARDFTSRYNVTLVLKGTRTLVAAHGHPLYLNTTGNPGLSTGGSGDTLTGIIAALLAQGLAPIDAARFGVWLHGHAADLVLAERGCEEGLTPTMLSAHLGAALVSLRRQAVMPEGLLERARELG